MPYAEGTTVTVARSQAEIGEVIRKYGATGYTSGWQGDQAMVEFIADARRVRIIVDVPTDWRDFELTDKKVRRKQAAAEAAMDAEERRLWRALHIVIKAKLEVVQSGITTLESEFMAHIVMPDGRTVAEHVTPVIRESYDRGRVSGQLLAIGGSTDA